MKLKTIFKDPGRQPLFRRLEIEKLIKLIDNGLFKILKKRDK